ncbi:cytochrome P450 [Aquiluna borgnonia]|uniref:Cytochrome P450 n=1 Tax=Aquiluna borgnonia TaxID=2499157 RepID=A0A7D4TJH2_9MICO|nr:cytochrome P450 [Aquiluna borgnonia]QKJ25671.1 cytochrome P450 [Aquiluna borgnonia]
METEFHSATIEAPTIQQPAGANLFYDPLSYAIYDHPYDVYKQLRDNAPVYFSPRLGVYVLSRYADVQAAFKNHEQMISALGNDIDGTHDSYGKGNLVAQDPPRHTALRQSIRRVFALKEILAKEDGIRGIARELIRDMRSAGGGDFATEYALPFAFAISTRLIGLPGAKNDITWLIDHLSRSMERTVGEFGVPEDAAKSNAEAEDLIHEVVQKRFEQLAAGADPNVSDVITQVSTALQRGKVDADEVVGLTHLVYSASTDAPSALLTNCVAVLDKFPQLQVFLREHPEMITNFIEEVLRYDTPGQNVSRQTTVELTFSGVAIPANSRVMLLQGSANRDERVFENPDLFDVTRDFTKTPKIASFGDGIHACMGAPLARLMARITVEVLLEQPDEIRIVGFPERWVKQLVRGFSKLPIKFVSPGTKF